MWKNDIRFGDKVIYIGIPSPGPYIGPLLHGHTGTVIETYGNHVDRVLVWVPGTDWRSDSLVESHYKHSTWSIHKSALYVTSRTKTGVEESVTEELDTETEDEG